jgi:ubiquinone/menaquinone biosynthesis C-methylase UbiE
MTTDKSLFHYGKPYNILLDPLIKPMRRAIVDQVPVDSSVLDIGCGTGLLCFELKREKDCRVVGIDLSRKMLDYARSINPNEDIQFLHQDGTNMQDLGDDSFDLVILLNVIHELVPDNQLKMLEEAFRVGRSILIFDSNVPIPWNLSGIIKRLIEISFGIDHYPQFREYINSGGVMGILEGAGYKSNIKDRKLYTQESNQMVTVLK